MANGKEDQTVFTEFFGTSPRIRIIDYLLDNPLSSYTKKEISQGAKISWASLFNHWETLEKMKVVKEVRKVGRIRLYQLNDSEPLVQHLKKIDFVLMKMAADQAEEDGNRAAARLRPFVQQHESGASMKVKVRAAGKK